MPARVNVATAEVWSGVTGATLSAPARDHTAGNALIVCVCNSTVGFPATGISDTAGNTYTKITQAIPTDNSFIEEIWYAKNITGHASNVVTATWPTPVNFRGIAVLQYTGLDTVAPFDATAKSTTNTNPVTTGTLTTTAGNEIHLLLTRWGWGTAIGWPTGFTLIPGLGANIEIAEAVVADPMSGTYAINHAGAGSRLAVAAAFKPTTATGPGPITGSQKAWTYARSGMMRSGSSRSNYVLPHITALLTHYDEFGNTSTLDLSDWIRLGSITITQALNDEPDTCTLMLIPERPGGATIPIVPQCGDHVSIGLTSEGVPGGGIRAAGGIEFAGTVASKQHVRRAMNESPWIALTLQDWMWQFDARFVTWLLPTQSATTSIEFIVQSFVNQAEIPQSPGVPFTLESVQQGMPAVEAFAVEMWRPSTVLRRLVKAVGGGFYLDAERRVHAWAGAGPEPNQTNPQPLTNDLPSLKRFAHTVDASQLRKRVIVEGQRTNVLLPVPQTFPPNVVLDPGIPVTDSSLFLPYYAPSVPNAPSHVARLGAQWVKCSLRHPPLGAAGASAHAVQNAPPTTGDRIPTAIYLDVYPYPLPDYRVGWIKVGDQFLYYSDVAVNADGITGYKLLIPNDRPIGRHTMGVLTGDTITFPDYVDWLWGDLWPSWKQQPLWGQPVDTPLIVFAYADNETTYPQKWPHFEALVQDGRYSYAGAQERADAELAAFRDPLISATWETDDYNARPGRSQVVALTGADPVAATLTIQSVSVSFPLRTIAPRRVCTAAQTQAASLLDVLVTNQA